jgi:hypothetical protein
MLVKLISQLNFNSVHRRLQVRPSYTYMDAPSLQGLSFAAGEQEKIAVIHPAFSFRLDTASALMEYAGWLLYKFASSRLVVHVRFDQPRSDLSCHQRSIAQATCGRKCSPPNYDIAAAMCCGSYALREDNSAQASRAFLLAMATAATL